MFTNILLWRYFNYLKRDTNKNPSVIRQQFITAIPIFVIVVILQVHDYLFYINWRDSSLFLYWDLILVILFVSFIMNFIRLIDTFYISIKQKIITSLITIIPALISAIVILSLELTIPIIYYD
ncbi:MAG: hypothetical protein ACFFDW_12785, partial [Candidatus Thorarchaeota archaeon]